jgi:hypothetical protein
MVCWVYIPSSLSLLWLFYQSRLELATMDPARDFRGKEVCSPAHPVALCLHMLIYNRKL